MTKAGGWAVGVLLLGMAGTAGAAVVINADDSRSWPIKRQTHQKFAFSPTGKVKIASIAGSVRVTAGDTHSVQFTYERTAKTEADYACETLRYEHSDDRLRIWVDAERECRVIHASDSLTVTVPRGASVAVESVGDEVSVAGVEGRIELTSIGDSASVTGAHELEAESIGDSLRVDIAKLGPRGIEIESVGDSVELNLPKRLDARLRIESVGDEISGPGLRLQSPEDDFEAVLGKGGPLISITSVGDTVRIGGGPSLERKGVEY